MATIASAQSGNWNTTTTWAGGVIPTTIDIVNISHDIYYDGSDSNTYGLITLNTNGKLTLGDDTYSQQRILRASGGITITGGKLYLKRGAELYLASTKAILMNNTANSELICTGDLMNANTTLAAAANKGDYYIDVVDSSIFATKDIISIYDDVSATCYAYNNRYDECVEITCIDNNINRIYFKRFVTKPITITKFVDNHCIEVPGAKAWHKNDKFTLLYQRENAAKLYTIDRINYEKKLIYTAESIDETEMDLDNPIGLSTLEQNHSINHRVYRLNSVLHQSVTAGSNTINIGNNSAYTVGDTIAIGGSTYVNSEHRTITAKIDTNILQLNSNLTNSHDENGIVVKLNRNCTIIGSANKTYSNTNGYIYILAGTAANRRVRLENIDMQYVGNTSSVLHCGCVNRNQTTAYGSNIFINNVLRHTNKAGNLGFFGSYSYSYNTYKNNVTYDTTMGGIHLYSGGSYNYVSGTISLKSSSNNYYTHSVYGTSLVYNHTESSNAHAYMIYYAGINYYTNTPYSSSNKHWSLIEQNKGRYCALGVYQYINFDINDFSHFLFEKIIHNRLIYNDLYNTNSNNKVYDIITDGSWKSFSATNITSAHDYYRITSVSNLVQPTFIKNHYDTSTNEVKDIIIYQYGILEQDYDVKHPKNPNYSWRCSAYSSEYHRGIGFGANVHGEVGKKITIGAWVRKNSAFTGTVRIQIFNGAGPSATVIHSPALAANTWTYLTYTYECINDEPISIWLYGYCTRINSAYFWIDSPVLYTNDMLTNTGVFSNMFNKNVIHPTNSPKILIKSGLNF